MCIRVIASSRPVRSITFNHNVCHRAPSVQALSSTTPTSTPTLLTYTFCPISYHFPSSAVFIFNLFSRSRLKEIKMTCRVSTTHIRWNEDKLGGKNGHVTASDDPSHTKTIVTRQTANTFAFTHDNNNNKWKSSQTDFKPSSWSKYSRDQQLTSNAEHQKTHACIIFYRF